MYLILAIVNNAAMNITVHVLFLILMLLFSVGKNLGVELLGNVEFFFYYFEESPYSFLLTVAPNFISTNSAPKFI